MHRKLPQSTVKLVLAINESYERERAKRVVTVPLLGHTPSTAGTFRKKFRKKSGKTPETLSERFLEFRLGVRLGSPKPYNSRRLRLPEHFQNSLPPSTAGDASFFRSGPAEGLSELVMAFPAVLGVFLTCNRTLSSTEKATLKVKMTSRGHFYACFEGYLWRVFKKFGKSQWLKSQEPPAQNLMFS